jgi:hypothetical protein
VLDRGNDVVGLDAANGRAHQHARQQRIFRQIFKRAAIARIARQVDAAGQQHVVAAGARFGADHRAAIVQHGRIPACRLGNARRQRRRPRLRAPTQATPRLASVSLSAGTPRRGNRQYTPRPARHPRGSAARREKLDGHDAMVSVVRSSAVIALTV